MSARSNRAENERLRTMSLVAASSTPSTNNSATPPSIARATVGESCGSNGVTRKNGTVGKSAAIASAFDESSPAPLSINTPSINCCISNSLMSLADFAVIRCARLRGNAPRTSVRARSRFSSTTSDGIRAVSAVLRTTIAPPSKPFRAHDATPCVRSRTKPVSLPHRNTPICTQ